MIPFRLGATSYIIPDDILPNVRFLADKVQDVELVLFEVDDGPNNLPGPEVIAVLQALADAAVVLVGQDVELLFLDRAEHLFGDGLGLDDRLRGRV